MRKSLNQKLLSALDLTSFATAVQEILESAFRAKLAALSIHLLDKHAQPKQQIYPAEPQAELQIGAVPPQGITLARMKLLCPLYLNDEALAIVVANLPAESPANQETLKKNIGALERALEPAPHILHHILRVQEVEQLAGKLAEALEAGANVLRMKSLSDVVSATVQNAVEKLHCAAAVIALVSDDGESLKIEAVHGAGGGVQKLQIPLGDATHPLQGIVTARDLRALDHGQIAALHPDLQKFEQALAVPLIARERCLGVILAFWSEANEDLEQRKAILRVFAQQVVHAIENAQIYAEMDRIAGTDALTGAYNRHYFERVLRTEIARMRRYRHPISLLMVDVCDFKRINDTYGHLAGDEILKKVADLLRSNVREPDTVARFGGDEFVVLMPDTHEKQARKVQKRIRKAAEEYNECVGPRERFVLSMGLKSQMSLVPDELIDEADRAMYQDKDLRIRRRIIEALVASNEADLEEMDKTVASVLKLLREKEPFYFAHALRVMEYALALGREVGLDDDTMENIALGALLHDVGKVAIHSSILNKPGPLTPEEYEVVKTHTVLGDDVLSGADRMREIRSVIRAHHERWDGKMEGEFAAYPDGLSGDRIPLPARLLKIADVYDAITTDRPYREARPQEVALEIIEKEAGKSFDPELAEIFVAQIRGVTTLE